MAPEDIERYEAALLAVPRERFVLPEDIGFSADDLPTALDREGLATVSAPHAYLLTYGCLGLGQGDHLIELGTGTGYGAALGSHVVGARGHVTTIEIDPVLELRARRILSQRDAHGEGPITLLCGGRATVGREAVGARGGRRRRGARGGHVRGGRRAPSASEALPEGGRAVVPVGEADEGRCWCAGRGARRLRRSIHGAVRYVAERQVGGLMQIGARSVRAL